MGLPASSGSDPGLQLRPVGPDLDEDVCHRLQPQEVMLSLSLISPVCAQASLFIVFQCLQHQKFHSVEEGPHQCFLGGVTGSVLDFGILGACHYGDCPTDLEHHLLPVYNHTGVFASPTVGRSSFLTAGLVENFFFPTSGSLCFQGLQIFILFTARTPSFKASVSQAGQAVLALTHTSTYHLWKKTLSGSSESYRDLTDKPNDSMRMKSVH